MKVYCQNCAFYFEHHFECSMCGSADIEFIREDNGSTSMRCNACGTFSPAFARCPRCRGPVYDIDPDD